MSREFLRFAVLTALVCSYAVAGQAQERILLPSRPALSPDGSTLAFGYAGDVWTAPVKGGVAQRLTVHPDRDGEPVYSPDGKSLAFVSSRTGSSQVFLVDADGGTPRQITHHTAGYSLQDWSPDGSSLLTLGSRDHHWRRPQRLLQVTIDQRTNERLLFDAYAQDGRISPDGSQVLFVREGERWWRKGYQGSRAAQIWLYDVKQETFTKVLEHVGGCRSPLWMPDGSGFYYVGAESGSFNLRAYDFQSEESKQLTRFEDDSVVFPCLSRDGSTIVFRHLFDLYRLRPEKKAEPIRIKLSTDGDSPRSATLRRTLTDADAVTMTEDGLEIAFTAGGDVWVMDTELKEPVAVTRTAVEEREPVFVDGGKSLLFLREENGQVDLYRASPEDDEEYWWRNASFTITRLTNDAATEVNLQRSPDGKHIAFVKTRGELWVTDLEGKNGKLITQGFDVPDYDFSPDGKWIAYSREDDDFNDEVWIAPVDGSREPFNVSRHPDDDGGPVWSSDGRILAFTGRRSAEEVDVYYTYLQAEDDDRTSRDRKLKEALEKINKARRKKPTSSASGKPGPNRDKPSGEKTSDDSKEEKEDAEEKGDDKEEEEKSSSLPEVKIDFDGLHERVRRISVADSAERGLFWFGDGKTLAFQSRVSGKSGTYTVEIPGRLSPRLLTEKTGSFVRRLKSKTKAAWLSDDKPGTVDLTGGRTESFAFSGRQEISRRDRQQATFDVAWRLMRDNWYDGNFNNRNWDAVRRKYTDAAGAAADTSALSDVVNLMLGELNGSHLGFYPRRESSSRTEDWRPQTAHLGVRFAEEHQGPGLLVRDVVKNGPADKAGTQIKAGETILSIDGTTVDPDLDLTTILNGRLDRDVRVLVKDADGEQRTVVLRPVSYSNAQSLLYPQFIDESRELVDRLSDGRFGYLHIQAMNMSSFLEFERQLYNVGYGKDGLVIDVRENGGGFTTDHLLTALTQPRHALTVPRGGGVGYPHDRKVYASWHKPIVVLCNQNSFSNAEIFSHAVRGLKRGQLVGVQTAGGVISTGAARVMDAGTLRQPFRGWFVLPTGQDMELNGAMPHHEVWPLPGELPAGKDRQLEKAVQVLKKDVKKWKKRPEPKLIKASERDK